MTDIEQHLKAGLKIGFIQNQILHTSYGSNEAAIVEYLLTVNVAQRLIEWNSENNNMHSLYLEYSTERFFKNAFLPYMEVGNNIWDREIIHPEVLKIIEHKEEIRTGRIDLVVCKEKLGFGDFKESLIGIELKGINPNLNKVIEDIDRLTLAIEMNDKAFNNSIKTGYCLFIKKLGGNKRLSSKKILEEAMNRSINHLQKVIKTNVKATTAKIEVLNEVLHIKTLEDFQEQKGRDDLTSDEVAEETNIVFSILVKITRV